MRITKNILCFASIFLLVGSTACSTFHKSATLQGMWAGREIGASPETPRNLVLSRQTFEFRGADPEDWGQGIYSLREDTRPKQLILAIKQCGLPDYVGKTAYAIYKLEGDTLTLAGSAPGSPAAPANFDTADARRFEFKKQ
jgi:uncharacterized protein (TIGR03067 family)